MLRPILKKIYVQNKTTFQNKLWYFLECVLLNNDMIFIKNTMYK